MMAKTLVMSWEVVHASGAEDSSLIFWKKTFFRLSCSVGLDNDFQAYNVNADEAACAIAKRSRTEKLAFLTDIEGVYKDPKDPATLIPELSAEDAIRLINDGYIEGGMLPKLRSCIDALENGVSRSSLSLDGRTSSLSLPALRSSRTTGIGTAI